MWLFGKRCPKTIGCVGHDAVLAGIRDTVPDICPRNLWVGECGSAKHDRKREFNWIGKSCCILHEEMQLYAIVNYSLKILSSICSWDSICSHFISVAYPHGTLTMGLLPNSGNLAPKILYFIPGSARPVPGGSFKHRTRL